VAANHSGANGLDALLLRHEIARLTGREARVLANRAWFADPSRATGLPTGLGLVPATLPKAVSVLREGSILIVFPEAERGNFKPSSEAYRLKPFRPGFVRMAAQARAPIVAVAVRGAEEATINLTSLRLPPLGKLTRLPLPLNPVPLPSKWTFDVLESVPTPSMEHARDRATVEACAEEIRAAIQTALNRVFE
jgi:1-acyl-sn-glycerol-3-phosphate acyltransferase